MGWGEGDGREEELVNWVLDGIYGVRREREIQTTSSPLAWEGGS